MISWLLGKESRDRSGAVGGLSVLRYSVVDILPYQSISVVTRPMTTSSDVLTFLLLVFGGWVNRRQQKVIDYLLEENRVLRELAGDRRLRLTNDQRRRLAVKGKALGRKVLGEIAGIVTPDTILRWYRQLVACPPPRYQRTSYGG